MARSMNEQSTRLDLPLLLPEVQDVQDDCITRCIRLLESRDGVARVHVVRPGEPVQSADDHADTAPSTTGALLCLHYDPERLTLAQVTDLAKNAGVGVTDRFAHAVIPFRAVGSEDNGRRMGEELRALAGVTAATVNQAAQLARVEYDRRHVDLAAIRQRLSELGAELTPPTPADAARATAARPAGGGHPIDETAPEEAGWYARNRELAWSLTAGVLLAVGWLVGRAGVSLFHLPLLLYAAAYAFGARDNIGHFLNDLRKGHFHFDIDLLMVVAAAGAAILGQWVEGALLLFLFSLGHALEHYALGRARNAIKALAELAPSRGTVLRDVSGVRREIDVPIEDVHPGDHVVVKPAERIPVDGTVREGRSGVNQAPITGESMPVDKSAGEPVYAGSVNGEGALVIEVTAAVGDRTLDRVITLVANAETQKAPTQQFTDRFERIFVPIVLVADALLIVTPPLVGFWTWSESFYRAMALLVAASPCALALGTPAAVLAGIAQAARKGVLIKGGAFLETLGTIDVLALDKTGTITKGEPSVTDLVPAPGISDEELLATTAAVEQRSQHPLARAVLRAANAQQLVLPQPGELEAISGMGIRSTIDGRVVVVGGVHMFEETAEEKPEKNTTGADHNGVVPDAVRDTVRRLQAAGRSTMVVRHMPATGRSGGAEGPDDVDAGGRERDGWLGVIGIADEPRADVAAILKQLRAAGIKRIVMLTGDNEGVGNAVGRAVGVDEVRAGLLPEDKVTAIQQLAAEGRVAMVGDGVNDAPALANATIGIAMGGAGTAAALETADVALMGDDLGRLSFAIELSRQARRIIKQNLFIALGVIAILVVATVTGLIGIGPAVVVHEGSTLVVIANALRLLAYEGQAPVAPSRQSVVAAP